MKRTISGYELRDRLLSRIAQQETVPTEEMRIEALSSPGNRELLELIATKQPRSISELAAFAGRFQPNVSRSLNALARAGLLTVTHDGRASVPTLTPEGRQKARDLGFVPSGAHDGQAPSASPHEDTAVLSAAMTGPLDGDLETDAVQARITVRFPGHEPITAHGDVNLNDVCTSLLANWWRALYRRADPFKLFALERQVGQQSSQAVLLAESTGHVELFAQPANVDQELWRLQRICLTTDAFTALVLDMLVKPQVSRLRAGRRFDRPIESLLHRTEEILHNPADLAFWRTAGALGLTYQHVNDAAAADVGNLITAVVSEDARFDLASAIGADQLSQSLAWVAHEIKAKAEINDMPRLIELRRGGAAAIEGVEPWRIGTDRAREARRQIGLAQDVPIGGISELAHLFRGDEQFAPSLAGEELLRGFQGRGDSVPVIIVKDEGPKRTAFLMSRAIGDYLVFGSREAPIVDIYSDRQAVGRAFAAEFMAPAQGVIHMIEEEGVPLMKVAEHYGVGPEVVRWQYKNNIGEYGRAA